MPKTLATPQYGLLKNVDPNRITSGMAVASLIAAEAERREDIKVQSVQYDRDRGIGVLVEDAGDRQHLAAALGLNTRGRTTTFRVSGIGVGEGRSGEMLGYKVTVWNLET